MGAIFEVRKFQQLAPETLKNEIYGFIDIYLHRRGHIHIGIKFRQPKERAYGWKLNKFQCKICEVKCYQGKYKLEQWKKYRFDLENSIKLKIRNVEATEQEKSQDDLEDQQDNIVTSEKLAKKALKIYKKISKALLRSQLRQNQIVKKWCTFTKDQQPELKSKDLELFVVVKDKMKTGKSQIGKIKVQSLIHNTNIYYFETECREGNNEQDVIKALKDWKVNVSYPLLCEKLMNKDYQRNIDKRTL